MNADIVILTPIDVEYVAVKKLLKTTSLSIHTVSGNTYLHARVKGKGGKYEVVLRKTGSGNLKVMNAVHQVVKDFSPKVILLTGTAGGLKKVKIGDLVIGNKAYFYEAGREKLNTFASRPEVLLSSKELVELADKLIQEVRWKATLPNAEIINCYIKPIASGEKIIEAIDIYLVDRIRKHYDDALALEMEAFGFLEAAMVYPEIKVLNIRSVSDMLGDKKEANKKDSREKSAEIAATFTMELIYNLRIKRHITPFVFVRNVSFFLIPFVVLFYLQMKLPPKEIQNEKIKTQSSEGTKFSMDEKLVKLENALVENNLNALKIAKKSKKIEKKADKEEVIKSTAKNIIAKTDTSNEEIVSGTVKEISSSIKKATDEIIKYKYTIHIFDGYRKVSGVQFLIDGFYIGRDPSELQLTQGKHFINLTYRGNVFSDSIYVPNFNYHEIKIMINDFIPIDSQ